VVSGQFTIYWSLPVAALAPDKPLDLETMRRDAREIWPEAAATIAQADDFSRATDRNVALPRWNEGRVLFIGDAAHGTSPQLGQGANLALLYAWTLADTLAAGGDLA
jgi:2-polyprenyl-6-methoxyphenol hydroxylase-like FAD-dependent oxidoreductase